MGTGRVAIIGAGIVGVSTAIWLQRFGVPVVLIDREGAAAGASFGNAGVLAASAVVPVPVPGILAKAPFMLLDRDQPLFLRWSYLPRLVPFLARYLRHATDRDVVRIARGLATLLHDSPDQHLALARGTPAEAFVRPCRYLYGYADRAARAADDYSWSIRRANGFAFHDLDAEGLAACDPALAGRFGWGVECPDHGLIDDPGAYVQALADHVVAQGGELLRTRVDGLRIENGRAVAALTDRGEVEAEEFVIATGAWSEPLGRALGITVRLESERGYHIEFHNPSLQLRAPVMVAAAKFVASPMRGRIRCAGIVEFGGLSAPASPAPLALMRRAVARIFPDLEYDRATEWMGHRPATPDSLPVIGRAPRAANVLVGYGHQHVGLTGGPKTGRWLAQMIAGKPVNADLAPFAPDRRA